MSPIQTIFNAVWAGAKAQGFSLSNKPRAGAHPLCMYRNPEGLKCNVGLLIPDELYTPEWEGQSVNNEMVEIVREKFAIDAGFLQLGNILGGLQGCHDAAKSAPEHEVLLRNFANDHGLEIPAEVANELG